MRPVAEAARNFDHDTSESEVAVSNPDAGELFDVVVLGFERRSEPPALGLCRVFGLDERSAQQLVESAPLTVRSSLTRVQAEYFRRALHSIGARVELRGEGALLGPVLQPSAASPVRADDLVEALHLPAAGAGPSGELGRGDALHLPAAGPGPFGELGRGDALRSERGRGRAIQPLTAAEISEALPAFERADASPLSAARLSLTDAIEPDAMDRHFAAEPRLSLASLPAPAKLVRNPEDNSKQAQELARHAAAGRSAQPKAAGSVALPRPVARQPSAAGPARAGRSAPEPKPIARSAEFWQSIPESLAFPFRGRGLAWLITIAVWAALANLLTALASVAAIAGMSVAFFSNSSLIAISADLHRRCMWAVSNGEDGLEEAPDFDPARILHVYVKSGAQLVVFGLCAQLPLLIWFITRLRQGGIASADDVLGSGTFWLLALAPACYWPLALATASLYNRFEAVWYVPVGLRILRRAPLECLCIIAIGALSSVVPLLLGWLITRGLGIPTTLAAACIGLPIGVSHAWLGALTGQLMRARPDAFE
jgi:hypothetical protein